MSYCYHNYVLNLSNCLVPALLWTRSPEVLQFSDWVKFYNWSRVFMCLCLKVTCQLNKDLNICYRWSEVKNGSEFTVVKEVFAFFVILICIASLHVCHTNTSDCQNFNIQGWFKKMQSADFKMINWFVKVDKFYPNIPGHTWGKCLPF